MVCGLLLTFIPPLKTSTGWSPRSVSLPKPDYEAGNQFIAGDLHQYDRYGRHRAVCIDVPCDGDRRQPALFMGMDLWGCHGDRRRHDLERAWGGLPAGGGQL